MIKEIKRLNPSNMIMLTGILSLLGTGLLFTFSSIIGWVVYNDPFNIEHGILRLLAVILSFSPMFALWAARIYVEVQT